MKYQLNLALAAIAVTVEAFPGTGASSAADPRFTQFAPPGPGDVRSPCPGLNTLANHGFINHNGKDLTIPGLIAGLGAGLNVGPDFAIAIGGAGLLSSPNPAGGSFDLNMLDQHNFPIEHDSSLSRQDAYFGNDYSFYSPNWDMVLSHFPGPQTDLVSASQAKFTRYNNSLHTNPTFTYGPREFVLSFGETALYLQTMSNPQSANANVDYVRMLFEQEKLPYELGWRPSVEPITLVTLGAMVVELFSVSPEPLVEGLFLTVNSYQDLFEVLDGTGGLLGNLTSEF